MASIDKRELAGGVTRYRVQWREGDKRPKVSFEYEECAKRFKDLVNAHRNTTPPRQTLIDAGFGYLLKDDGPSDVPTFVAYAYTHIELTRASDDTKADYRSYVRLDLEPFFWDSLITEITRSRLREWQDWMARKPDPEKGIDGRGLSDKSIRNVRGTVVDPVLNRAMLRGENGEPALLEYNPLDGLSAPAGKSVRRQIIADAEQALILIQAAYEHDVDAADLIVTDIATGMRWGEISGLPPWAVDVEEGYLDIVQVAARNTARRPGVPYLYIREEPKTEAGFRRIPFGTSVGAILARRIAALPTRRVRKSKRPRLDLVFASTSGGIIGNQNFRRNHWLPILGLAQERGLVQQITPHGLRKSLITLLAESKVDPVTLKGVAGHADHRTTLQLYTEPTGRGYKDVRTAVDSLLGNALGAA